MADAARIFQKISRSSTVALRSGVNMPIFGLGTWLSSGDGMCKASVEAALKSGYIHIDTAQMYENEEGVGAALKEFPDIFVTSKLRSSAHGEEETRKALDETLRKLQRENVDLFLIHTPKGGKVLETWKTILALRDAGKIRVAGVSNFGVDQLKGIKAAGLEMPEVNQVEIHIFRQQPELRKYCAEEGIVITGYCPLARVKKFGSEAIVALAEKYSKSEAQIWIRWSLQAGVITIPKSSNPKRIAENADVFDFSLDDSEMDALSKLNESFCASSSTTHQDLPWDELK